MFYEQKICLLMLVFLHVANPNCYRGNKTCCFGFYWKEIEQRCTDCAVGYFGINCLKHCRYPNYGKGCQKKCACLEAFCVPTIGCADANEDQLIFMKNKTTRFEITTHRSIKEEDIFFTSQVQQKTTVRNRKNNITNISISIAVIGILVLMLIGIALRKVLRKKTERQGVDKTHQLQINTAPASQNIRDTSRLSERKSNIYDIISENEQSRDNSCLNVNPLSKFPDDSQKTKHTPSASNAGNIYLDTCQSSSSRESNHFYSPL